MRTGLGGALAPFSGGTMSLSAPGRICPSRAHDMPGAQPGVQGGGGRQTPRLWLVWMKVQVAGTPARELRPRTQSARGQDAFGVCPLLAGTPESHGPSPPGPRAERPARRSQGGGRSGPAPALGSAEQGRPGHPRREGGRFLPGAAGDGSTCWMRPLTFRKGRRGGRSGPARRGLGAGAWSRAPCTPPRRPGLRRWRRLVAVLGCRRLRLHVATEARGHTSS